MGDGMMTFAQLMEEESSRIRGGRWAHTNNVPVQCPGCGRFAKYAGGRSYYNGTYDCYSFDTICSKCGRLTTECV